MSLISALLSICNLVLLLPVALLASECFAAWIPRKILKQSLARPPVIVVIPAHNEAAVLGMTLCAIRRQMIVGDRLTVVADNCQDGTAAIAMQAGAEVWERFDDANRGKGFALAWGLAQAKLSDDSIAILLDADTEPAPGAIDALTDGVIQSGRPQQAIYLMGLPLHPTLVDRVSAFAFCVKNQVRLSGAQVLGLPCHLTGTGMAFRYRMLKDVNLASGNLVEDMQLGIDLALHGIYPKLCSGAKVMGILPEGRTASVAQRRRWEHGHLETLFRNVPRLLIAGIIQRRGRLILLALDLSVPPLALLVIMWGMVLAISTTLTLVGLAGALPTRLGLVEGLLLAFAILTAWIGCGRKSLPFWNLLYVPVYLAWKMPIYLAAPFRRQKAWVRTARS